MSIINQSDTAKVIITDDGSSTVYLPKLDETYHSTYGAINEARHVFIENGLAKFSKLELRILEIGFGTGLNTLLTLIYALENKLRINYTTIEKFPLEDNVITLLNYSDKIEGSGGFFTKIHEVGWERSHQISDCFVLEKKKKDVLDEDLQFPENIDLVYFDAFAPSKQADLWNEPLFKKLYSSLRTNGKLLTYSSAGVVKRALRNSGFEVKRLPGPRGKHHMLLSTKL